MPPPKRMAAARSKQRGGLDRQGGVDAPTRRVRIEDRSAGDEKRVDVVTKCPDIGCAMTQDDVGVLCGLDP